MRMAGLGEWFTADAANRTPRPSLHDRVHERGKQGSKEKAAHGGPPVLEPAWCAGLHECNLNHRPVTKHDIADAPEAYLGVPIHFVQEPGMPKFVIEREMPAVGQLKAADLQAASQKSCDVLRAMGPQVQWVHSYVTADKINCVYNAEIDSQFREHAQRAGFPANSIARVTAVIDPTTAEPAMA